MIHEHETRVQVRRIEPGGLSEPYWYWWCNLHRCAAGHWFERSGQSAFWTIAQAAADRHARQHHHRPISHDAIWERE